MADIKQVADAADMIVRSRCFWLPFGLPVFILSPSAQEGDHLQ